MSPHARFRAAPAPALPERQSTSLCLEEVELPVPAALVVPHLPSEAPCRVFGAR